MNMQHHTLKTLIICQPYYNTRNDTYMTAGTRNLRVMEMLSKLGLKIKNWKGPSDTRHDTIATEVMLQAYFHSEELTGAYTQPPENVTASYAQTEKTFFIGVPEQLLEAFLDKYEADLTAPGESKTTFNITCGKGTITYQLSPFEPNEAAKGSKRKVDEDLWGFLRGEKGRTYRIDDIKAATCESFRKAGIDASGMKVTPQRNRKDGGITCIEGSFTVNDLAPTDPLGHYPYEFWPACLVNIPVSGGYMTFECSRAMANRLKICEKCLRDTRGCTGHGKGVKRAATTDTPREVRARAVQASMDAIKRFNARNKHNAGSSTTMEQ